MGGKRRGGEGRRERNRVKRGTEDSKEKGGGEERKRRH